MTRVVGGLDWRKTGDEEVMLLSPVEFVLDSGRIVIAEKGFTYDGGSVPKVFRNIISPFGTCADWGWCLHDRLYAGHRELGEMDWTRREADLAMLEMLQYKGVADLVAYGAFAAVRGGASQAWMSRDERKDWDEREELDEYLDG